MLYTVGDRESYTKGLADAERTGEPFRKLGKTDTYAGGIVFPDAETAVGYINRFNLAERYDVYRLDTTIENTYSNGIHLCLLESCDIHYSDVSVEAVVQVE